MLTGPGQPQIAAKTGIPKTALHRYLDPLRGSPMTRRFDPYESRTPVPGIVAAWLVLGTAPSERVPWWAAQ